MDKPENPPAFPQQCADALDVGMVHAGMTLRDWFAGQAIAGLMSRGSALEAKDRAEQAYRVADAMLAARVQP